MTKKIHLYLLCVFFSLSSILTNAYNTSTTSGNIQRVRIDFTMPDGYVRHLLLAFTKDNSATDGYDYGYDAQNKDAYPYDLNWMVDDLRCVIQGVGAFDNTKIYPFWMFMSKDGDIKISLEALENFDAPIDLFIYDALLNTYTKFNDTAYTSQVKQGTHKDRYYLAFKDNSASGEIAKTLSTDDINLQNTRISYFKNTQELYVNTNNSFIIKSIHVYNILGKELLSINHVNASNIKIPVSANQSKYGIVRVETEEGRHLTKKIGLY